VGLGAYEDEQRRGGDYLRRAGAQVLEEEVLQPPFPAAVNDGGLETNVDVRRSLELLDEVFGHARGERASAYQERHAGGVLTKVGRRLPG
jgi:hypothetical protein